MDIWTRKEKQINAYELALKIIGNKGYVYQIDLASSLVGGYYVTSPDRHIRGRAKSYLGRYKQSFQSTLNKLTRSGFEIIRQPGPKGGEYGAIYRAQLKKG